MNKNRDKQIEKENIKKNEEMQSKIKTIEPKIPLTERLSTYAASDAYPFHMPGHKRQIKMGITSFPNPFSVDITEIEGFDNLHHAENILKDSMESAASAYGADRSWYLVNGSTCGILAAIASAVKPGEKILMARNSHKSSYHAVFLNQLEPVYLYPEKVPDFEIPGGIKPDQVEKLLSEHPEIRVVFVTSPTYEGVVSDIRGISEVAHRYGAALIVDEAHGAHLSFGDGKYFPNSALDEGADLVIQSLHKTLPSLTQTAILHLKSSILDAKRIEQYLSVYQSSSPSYILIASMENCVRYMAERGAYEMTQYGARLRELREKLAKFRNFQLLTKEICGESGVYGYDPSKLVIFPKFMTGTELAEILRSEYHLESEMSTGQYVILMTSFMDTDEGFSRLERALLELDARVEKLAMQIDQNQSYEAVGESCGGGFKECNSYKFPQRVCLPWQAWHGKGVLVPLEEAKGRTAKTCMTIYPPGVPMLMPGELIGENETKKIRDAYKLGLTVEGIIEKNADESKLWIEVIA